MKLSFFRLLINAYQLTLSPDHGILKGLFPRGICRYEPTCSEYMKDALEKYGFKGFIMGLKRIGRCHPFARGGYDPL